MANRISGVGPLRPAPAHWSPYTAPDLCAIPSGVEGLGAFAPAQSRELRGVEIQIPPYIPYPIYYLLHVSAHPGGPMRPDRVGPGYRIWQIEDRGLSVSYLPSAIFSGKSGGEHRKFGQLRIHNENMGRIRDLDGRVFMCTLLRTP